MVDYTRRQRLTEDLKNGWISIRTSSMSYKFPEKVIANDIKHIKKHLSQRKINTQTGRMYKLRICIQRKGKDKESVKMSEMQIGAHKGKCVYAC